MLNHGTNYCDFFPFWDDWYFLNNYFCCCYSVAKSCLTLCQSHGLQHASFPLLHYLLEFAQTHVHWVSDAIPAILSSVAPSPSAFNLSQHQGLFQWVKLFTPGGQSTGALASTLPMNSQGWFPVGLTDLISLQSKGRSRIFSSTIKKHQFFGGQL